MQGGIDSKGMLIKSSLCQEGSVFRRHERDTSRFYFNRLWGWPTLKNRNWFPTPSDRCSVVVLVTSVRCPIKRDFCTVDEEGAGCGTAQQKRTLIKGHSNYSFINCHVGKYTALFFIFQQGGFMHFSFVNKKNNK